MDAYFLPDYAPVNDNNPVTAPDDRGEVAGASMDQDLIALYLTMKDRRINQDDVVITKAATGHLAASKSYAAVRAPNRTE